MNAKNPNLPLLGFRHLVSFMLFLCVLSNFVLRVNLSMAIVAMSPKMNSTDYMQSKMDGIPIFDWSAETRSTILSSFFFGYLVANIPASILGCHFNNKTLLTICSAVSSLLALITPTALLSFGAPGLIAVRFTQGVFQSFLLPMCHGIIARWALPSERGRLVGFIMSGIQCGTMSALVFSGLLASSSFGWPSIFYVTGTVSLLSTIIWTLLGSESPQSSHRLLGESEANCINDQLKTEVSQRTKENIIPWHSILTSRPVWTLVVAHVGNNWGFWLLLTQMPTYLHTVLGMDIKKDGFLSALPYLSTFLLQFPIYYIADTLNRYECTSLTTSRKIWNTFSMWGGATGLLALGYVNNTNNMAIFIYIFIMAINCAGYVGFKVNHLDLSPNFAGLLMGLSNGTASLGGLLAPTVVGFVVKDLSSVVQWRIIFFIGAAVLFTSNIIFILFASAKIQTWNSPRSVQSTTTSENENDSKRTEKKIDVDIELTKC